MTRPSARAGGEGYRIYGVVVSSYDHGVVCGVRALTFPSYDHDGVCGVRCVSALLL